MNRSRKFFSKRKRARTNYTFKNKFNSSNSILERDIRAMIKVIKMLKIGMITSLGEIGRQYH